MPCRLGSGANEVHQVAPTAYIPSSSAVVPHVHEQFCGNLFTAAASCSPPVGYSNHSITAERRMPASPPCQSFRCVQNTAAYGALFPFVVQPQVKLVLVQMLVADADVHSHCGAALPKLERASACGPESLSHMTSLPVLVKHTGTSLCFSTKNSKT